MRRRLGVLAGALEDLGVDHDPGDTFTTPETAAGPRDAIAGHVVDERPGGGRRWWSARR